MPHLQIYNLFGETGVDISFFHLYAYLHEYIGKQQFKSSKTAVSHKHKYTHTLPSLPCNWKNQLTFSLVLNSLNIC